MTEIDLFKNPYATEVILDLKESYKEAGIQWTAKPQWVEEKDIYWSVSLAIGSYPYTCELRIYPESFERYRLGDGYSESEVYKEEVHLGLALFRKREVAEQKGLTSSSNDFLYERPPKTLSKSALERIITCILIRGVILNYSSVANRLVYTNIELGPVVASDQNEKKSVSKLLTRSAFIPPIVIKKN